LNFIPGRINSILTKITDDSVKLIDNESIGKRKSGVVPGKKITNGICNISPGIESGKDRYIEKSKDINRGIFILTKNEIEELNILPEEKKFIKYFFKNSAINRYYAEKISNYYLLYVNDILDEDTFKKYDHLYQHFKSNKEILNNRAKNGVLESAYKKRKMVGIKD